MADGTGAGSFGGGFGQGLASILLEHRRTTQEKKDKEFNAILPVMIQLGLDSGDMSGAERWIGEYDPGLAAALKKNSPLKHVPALMQRFGDRMVEQPQTTPPSLSPATTPQPTAGTVQQDVDAVDAQATGGRALLPAGPPLVQATPGQQEAPQGPTFFGQKVVTSEERAMRAETIPYEAKIALARRMVKDGMVGSLDEALDRVGLRQSTTASGYQSVPGTINGEPAFGVFDRANGVYVDPQTHTPLQGFVPKDTEVSAGIAYNRAALLMGYSSVAEVPIARRPELEAEAERIAKELQQATTTGAGQGRYNSPIGVTEAKATNTVVGTTSADYAGQGIVPDTDRERAQDLTVVKEDLGRIKDLLGALPSEKTLAGVAPGAVMAARRRMNTDSTLKDDDGTPMSYRTALARLQANVDSMVNVLARVRGQQRGTQTERDAERAYNAVVQLQAGLLDPLGGDTQESAKARIAEALAGLDRVFNSLPQGGTLPTPKPQPAPAATPKPEAAAAPAPGGRGTPPPAGRGGPPPTGTGMFQDDKGNIWRDGKIIVPAQ